MLSPFTELSLSTESALRKSIEAVGFLLKKEIYLRLIACLESPVCLNSSILVSQMLHERSIV